MIYRPAGGYPVAPPVGLQGLSLETSYSGQRLDYWANCLIMEVSVEAHGGRAAANRLRPMANSKLQLSHRGRPGSPAGDPGPASVRLPLGQRSPGPAVVLPDTSSSTSPRQGNG